MRLYHYVSISFLLIFIYTVTKTPHNQRKITCSDATCKKYTILFDLPNVLIKENQTGFSKKIGYGKLASYAITHWKNPGYRCLDMLAAMSALEEQKPHITITLKKVKKHAYKQEWKLRNVLNYSMQKNILVASKKKSS